MELFVERVCFPVETLGPGRRVALWVQGCSRRCPGCLSPELFERRTSARRPVAVVLRAITAAGPCDGLTISGGEPFEQAEALCRLVDDVRRVAGLEILVYTGCTIEELRSSGGAALRLLERIDMLVDGPYREELPDTRIWRGSDNQRLHLLTTRARRHAADVDRTWDACRELRVLVDEAERVTILGIPRRGFRSEFARAMRTRGVEFNQERA